MTAQTTTTTTTTTTPAVLDRIAAGHDFGKGARVADVRRAVTESGSYFFSRGTVKVFASQCHGVYGGRLLVESIRREGEPREYRVLGFDRRSGNMLDAFSVGMFGSVEDARQAARELVREVAAR